MKTTREIERSTNGYGAICKQNGLQFIAIVNNPRELADNEYFALMVTDNVLQAESNPHVKYYDINTHDYLIGLERPSDSRGCYISKKYNSMRSYMRGTTIVVKTEQPQNYTIL